jgi:predicted small lipoprotein YifL
LSQTTGKLKFFKKSAHMKNRSFLVIVFLMLSFALTACGRDDPKTALEAAVKKLQANLEAKDTSAVLQQLDSGFQAQGQAEFDSDWARKTMTLMFLRYASVKVIAVSQTSTINPAKPSSGLTQAKVLVTGAQGLTPSGQIHSKCALSGGSCLEIGSWLFCYGSERAGGAKY